MADGNSVRERVLPDGRVERLFERTSILSGRVYYRILLASREQWKAWEDGERIQVALPHLSADDREFILTGIVPEEWETLREEE